MGERIELSEFPEENASNYVNGRLDPKAAEARRAKQLQDFEVQAKLAAECPTMAQRHRPRDKSTRT